MGKVSFRCMKSNNRKRARETERARKRERAREIENEKERRKAEKPALLKPNALI